MNVCTKRFCGKEGYIGLRGGEFLCRKHYDRRRAAEMRLQKIVTKKLGGPFPQRCPRRDEMGQQGGDPNDTPDLWEAGHGISVPADMPLLTCNYCGSIHPDMFMGMVKKGFVVGPTDKSYKVYVSAPLEDPEVKSVTDFHIHSMQVGKFYLQHLSVDQRREFVDLYNDRTMVVGFPGNFYAGVFFMRNA